MNKRMYQDQGLHAPCGLFEFAAALLVAVLCTAILLGAIDGMARDLLSGPPAEFNDQGDH